MRVRNLRRQRETADGVVCFADRVRSSFPKEVVYLVLVLHTNPRLLRFSAFGTSEIEDLKKMVSFGVYLAMFALTFNAAYGIRCYSCDSTKDMTCSFGFLSLTLPSVECSQSDSSFLSSLGSLIPSQCMKLVGVDRAGNEYIARGCTVNTGPVNACQLMAQAIKFGDSKDIQSLDCWTCTTDQCNSGSRFSAVAIVVGVVTACVAFLF